jgi:hypothetical protein
VSAYPVSRHSILTTKSECVECLIGEAIDIKPHPDNRNREEGFSLSRSWKPLIKNPEGMKESDLLLLVLNFL